VRFKIVPPAPDSLDRVTAIHGAVPIVPDDEESCCQRLMRDTGVPSQDEAKEWLTFCRALGLAEERSRGYARVRDADTDQDALADRFRENVYAVEETLAVVADGDEPLATARVFDRLRDRVPAWERARSTDWEERWRERVGRILSWCVLFGLVEEHNTGYVRA
jgi:hypothetical protein